MQVLIKLNDESYSLKILIYKYYPHPPLNFRMEHSQMSRNRHEANLKDNMSKLFM
jgi:hypothetical protein